jgi:hypothetical protein
MTDRPRQNRGFSMGRAGSWKGGASMQQSNQIRYYITKSGDEPTVRSVRVALGDGEPRLEAEPNVASVEATPAKRPVAAPASAVKRKVKDAIRGAVDR